MMECAPEGGGEPQHHASRLRAAATVARVVPGLWALLLTFLLIGGGGACGKSIFPTATPTSGTTATPTPGTGAFVYVSNNDGTVAEFKRTLTTGALTFLGTVAAGSKSGPFGITTSPIGNFLYVANTNGGVRQYTFNTTTGKLANIGTGSVAAGTNPRWVALPSTGGFAYVTNFGSATISAYTVNATTGALASVATATGPLANPYAAVANGSFVFVSDRANSGTIVTFPVNSDGSLGAGTSTPTVSSGIGMPGPVILDPTGQFLYVTDVVNGTVSLLNGVSTGALTLVQVYPTTSPGTPSIGLAIAAPSGGNEFLYTANQSAGTISIYGVSPTTGALTTPAVAVSGLSNPTGIAIDPTGMSLYVTNQTTGTISTYSINGTSGALTAVGTPIQTETSNTNSTPLFIAIGD
jgi:6-phosphogluconolactonase (cycloisomerase 2 family)